MATLKEVRELMLIVAAMFPNAPVLTAANYKAYHMILGDLDAGILKMAGMDLARKRTFLPTAGEWRKAAWALVEKANGIPSAHDAWAEVCKSFGSHGYYRGAPEWSCALIGQAIAGIGGYTALCVSENTVADRARFLQAYDSYLERERDDAAMLPEVRDVVRQLAEASRPALTKGLT